jgi:hypothetical protein
MKRSIYLDNQVGLFGPGKTQGIKRFFDSTKSISRGLPYEIKRPRIGVKLSTRSSGFPVPAKRVLDFYGKTEAKKIWFALNRWESRFNAKKSNAVIPTFYFSDYLEMYKRERVNLILPIYDLIPEIFSTEFPELETAHAAKAQYIDFASRIICISNETKKDLLEYYPHIDPKKLIVIEPLFPLPSLEELSIKFQKHKSGRDPMVLIHVGERFYYKNFIEAASAVISSPFPTNLRVIGGGSPTKEEFELAAAADKNGNSITFLGFLTEDQLEKEYANADFTLIATRKEGYGYSYVESLIRGTPVIAKSPNMWEELPGIISQDNIDLSILRSNEKISQELEAASIKYLWEKLSAKNEESISAWKSILEDID